MWDPTIKMTSYKLYFADPKAGQALVPYGMPTGWGGKPSHKE